MRSLKIKPRKQEGRVWCGPACAQMVLSRYRIKMSQRKIAKQLQIIKGGVDIAALGRFFLNKGFDVTLKFWIRGIPPIWFQMNDPDELRKILKRKLPRKVMHQTLLQVLDYLQLSGKIVIGTKGVLWVFAERKEINALIKRGLEV